MSLERDGDICELAGKLELAEAQNNQSFEASWVAAGRPAIKALRCDGDEVHRLPDPKDGPELQCCICWATTYWLSISFHSPFCSPKCLNQEWDNFSKALGANSHEVEVFEETQRRRRCGSGADFDSREQALDVLNSSDPATAGRDSLPARMDPCEGCPVWRGTGYLEIAAGCYRHLYPDERQRLAEIWTCHNGGRCEGAALILGADQ